MTSFVIGFSTLKPNFRIIFHTNINVFHQTPAKFTQMPNSNTEAHKNQSNMPITHITTIQLPADYNFIPILFRFNGEKIANIKIHCSIKKNPKSYFSRL